MIPQSFLKAIAAEYGISDAEFAALSRAIAGESTKAIALHLAISEDAVRKRLSEVYQKFQIEGRGPVKLTKLQQVLVRLYEKHRARSPAVDSESSQVQAQAQETIQPPFDWGGAPDVSVFYGRQEELVTLERWIRQDRGRLVTLLGMKGIGKTTLAVKVAKQVQADFERVVWRSLRPAPSLGELLTDLLQCLGLGSAQSSAQSLAQSLNGDGTSAQISQLLEGLRQRRCLLILDNVEAILRSGDFAGHYREGYKSYGELFRRLGEEPHQSCLVLTSLESPREISFLEGEELPVRSWLLSGLQLAAAEEILRAKGLSESDQSQWERIINLYRGNPLALKIIAATIQELFGGSVAEFFQQRMTLVVRDIRELIDDQFMRLSELEQELMGWLAIAQEPITLSQLRKQILLPIDPSELMQALESLSRRSLIEKSKQNQATFALQPAIMEYVITRLIEQVHVEICEVVQTEGIDEIQFVRNYRFVDQQAKSPIQTAQTRLILSPIRDRLLARFRNETLVQEYLKNIQILLHGRSPLEVGYAVENIRILLNLLESKSDQ